MECSFVEALEWEQYKSRALAQLSNIFPRCCYFEKALKMMDLIYQVRPETCVEIGVYGGASIYPTACALKYLKKGKVLAIDPWDLSHCLEGYTSDEHYYQWWGKQDLEVVFWAFVDMIARYELGDYCRVIRADAAHASASLPDHSIDILHIDGNHSEAIALRDAQLYLSKVKKGGYIWFDDVDLPATEKALAFLSEYGRLQSSFSIQRKCHLFQI